MQKLSKHAIFRKIKLFKKIACEKKRIEKFVKTIVLEISKIFCYY